MAVSGDNAVLGGPLDDVGANVDQGSAYVFNLMVRTSFKNAAKRCKAQQNSMGDEGFTQRYGSNDNGANAFGQCVRGSG